MLEVVKLVPSVQATECTDEEDAEAFHTYIYDQLASRTSLNISLKLKAVLSAPSNAKVLSMTDRALLEKEVPVAKEVRRRETGYPFSLNVCLSFLRIALPCLACF